MQTMQNCKIAKLQKLQTMQNCKMQNCKICKIAKSQMFHPKNQRLLLKGASTKQILLLKGDQLGGGRRRAAAHANPGMNFVRRLILKGRQQQIVQRLIFKRETIKQIKYLF